MQLDRGIKMGIDKEDLPKEFIEELKETMKQDRSLAEPFYFFTEEKEE